MRLAELGCRVIFDGTGGKIIDGKGETLSNIVKRSHACILDRRGNRLQGYIVDERRRTGHTQGSEAQRMTQEKEKYLTFVKTKLRRHPLCFFESELVVN
mmetsp:Transcript_15020/g.22114  ORF Transcript_15020/g.22114 Transcript_15020/m.22114 type:complete len:99 (+) Transcript_15020:349-645(+)